MTQPPNVTGTDANVGSLTTPDQVLHSRTALAGPARGERGPPHAREERVERAGWPPACAAQILRCPITKAGLRRLATDELARVNACIAAGALRQVDGTAVSQDLPAGFVDPDGRYAYRVDGGIIDLLVDHAIVLGEGASFAGSAAPPLGAETRDVQRFYDEYGWTKTTDQAFADEAEYEDVRPVSHAYRHKCHMRVKRFLPTTGRFLLDVGSGPLQYAEYLTYSEAFAYRICVDVSRRALREARKKLGDRGIYVLGDVTNLPIHDESVDALVCLHTLYHVPAEQQAGALCELQRVIKSGGTAVVVYSWGKHAPLTRYALLRFRFLRPLRRNLAWRMNQLRRLLGRNRTAAKPATSARLYYHAHPKCWWIRQSLGFTPDIRAWRSVGVDVLKRWVHPWLLGAPVLRLAYWLEERFPHVMGRIGQYPLFVIRK